MILGNINNMSMGVSRMDFLQEWITFSTQPHGVTAPLLLVLPGHQIDQIILVSGVGQQSRVQPLVMEIGGCSLLVAPISWTGQVMARCQQCHNFFEEEEVNRLLTTHWTVQP
jgi:hypothetical protein